MSGRAVTSLVVVLAVMMVAMTMNSSRSAGGWPNSASSVNALDSGTAPEDSTSANAKAKAATATAQTPATGTTAKPMTFRANKARINALNNAAVADAKPATSAKSADVPESADTQSWFTKDFERDRAETSSATTSDSSTFSRTIHLEDNEIILAAILESSGAASLEELKADSDNFYSMVPSAITIEGDLDLISDDDGESSGVRFTQTATPPHSPPPTHTHTQTNPHTLATGLTTTYLNQPQTSPA